MIPRSKTDRLVLTERLVEAGLTLIQEAEMFGKTALTRAVGVRNGLLIALLVLHPVRIKNFAALSIGDTFVNVDERWWLQQQIHSHRVPTQKVRAACTNEIGRQPGDLHLGVKPQAYCRGVVLVKFPLTALTLIWLLPKEMMAP
jgi:hypothetical protein